MDSAFCKNQVPLNAAFLAVMIHRKRLGLYGIFVEHNTVSPSGATNRTKRNTATYALHRWVNVKKPAQVLYCSTGNFHWCVDGLRNPPQIAEFNHHEKKLKGRYHAGSNTKQCSL
mmetsp:Transcript_1807/g.1916  ORF Transcript_1807/g.1916 Transcript_1807/m.1916 type:complete len:115 (+) Transcript_1807:354-698(+)